MLQVHKRDVDVRRLGLDGHRCRYAPRRACGSSHDLAHRATMPPPLLPLRMASRSATTPINERIQFSPAISRTPLSIGLRNKTLGALRTQTCPLIIVGFDHCHQIPRATLGATPTPASGINSIQIGHLTFQANNEKILF